MTRYARRRRRVRQLLNKMSFDALLVSSPANVFYLTGFRGEALLVLGPRAVLCTDRRYELEAREAMGRAVISADSHLKGAVATLETMKPGRVAFESEHLTWASHRHLVENLSGVEVDATEQVVESLRLVKDPEEVELITRAASVMDRALAVVVARLKPGMTERRVARDLMNAALDAGAEKMAFDTIVAFGPSAAHPHAVPSDRRLERGQVIKIDCGVMVEGYCCDITRTYWLGQPDKRLREVYGAVLEAQEAALAAARPGLTGSELDAVARQVLKDRGFTSEFSHGLGHGVGIQVHEGPRLGVHSDTVLKAGMVVTIEPGVYIEGWGGVRIEDTVVLTRSGCKPLTGAPKQVLS